MEPWIAEALAVLRRLANNAELVAAMSGSASGGGGAWAAWWIQRKKAAVLPALPSHREALSTEGNEGTRFLSAVHDLTMTVTEAWNITRLRSDADSVEATIDVGALESCSVRIFDAADDLRVRLSDYAARAEELQPCIRHLGDTWSYTSNDNYRTETYTVTTTDSDGRTQTETRTRQVYEDTDHYFTYDAAAMERAKAEIARWLRRCRSVDWKLLGIDRFEVKLENLNETERMFLERLVKTTVLEDKEAEVTDADLHHYANQWLLGTRVDDLLRKFVTNFEAMDVFHDKCFATMAGSQTHYHYNTTSRSHSGPPGYGARQTSVTYLRACTKSWADIDGMLTTAVEAADRLFAWAADPERVESDTEYAQQAIAAYQAAFPDSEIEIDQLPRHGWTAAVGAGLGGVTSLATYLLHPMGYGAW